MQTGERESSARLVRLTPCDPWRVFVRLAGASATLDRMWPRSDETLEFGARQMARMAEAPRVVTEALVTLTRVAREVGASWAVVGGQALVAHGVPRDTLDLDVLVEHSRLGSLAGALALSGWDALAFDRASGAYVKVPSPRTTTEAAIEWARTFDPASADDLASVLRAAQARKTPKRIDGEPPGRR